MDGYAQDTIMMIALTGLIAWALYLLFRRHQMATQARFQRIEAYNKLLEKFSTAKEFAEFLDTEQGKKLLEDPLPTGANPKKVALRFVQAGCLLAALGFGLLMNLSHISKYVESQVNPDINIINKELDFFYWTWIILAISAGCFFVASITYSLGKKWNLFSDASSR